MKAVKKQITLRNWKYRDKSDGGLSYYYTKINMYQVEICEEKDGIQIAIYKNGILRKPPSKMYIPLTDFILHYNVIMMAITSTIQSINREL